MFLQRDAFGRNKARSVPKARFNLQIDLTYSCNLHCRHCYQTVERGDRELTLNEWSDVLRQYKALASLLDVAPALTISGGEPLLTKIFRQVVECAIMENEGIEIWVLTNGIGINEDHARLLSDAKANVQISFDGANATAHDFFRGSDSFDRAMRGVHILNKHMVPYTFQSVLQTETCDSIPDLFKMAKGRGALAMDFTRLIQKQKGTVEKSGTMLSGPPLRAAYETILSSSISNHIPTNTDLPLFCLIDPNLGHPSSAGFLGFTISPYGDIQITSRIGESIGTVHEEDALNKVYFHNPLLKRLRNGMIRGCNKCEHFKKCRGDRNISYVVFGNFFGPDAHCWHWQKHADRLGQ